MAFVQNNAAAETDDTQQNRYLTFLLGEEVYGIAIGDVIEIIGVLPVTPLPKAPDYLKGIMNLRGKIVPVIDVRLKFKKPAAKYTERTCIVVVEVQEMTVGLLIDEVSEVLTIESRDIVPPPALKDSRSNYISGVSNTGGKVKLLLDCSALLYE
ncbi:MAG TPA: chemotaxis protein CheW [Feifaniaceae bacterium]|nr:chemotaxis protein CheW [Feifaniaceae bacterium]